MNFSHMPIGRVLRLLLMAVAGLTFTLGALFAVVLVVVLR